MENGERIFGLDLMRAIAALMIVYFHSITILDPLMGLPFGLGWFFGKFRALVYPLGILGVEIFFVLSGYLIGTILLKAYLTNNGLSLKVLRDFWIKRWSRTLPNYYLILLVNLIVGYLTFGHFLSWKYLFFFQNFKTPTPIFFVEAWSLSVEEWSYIFLPIVLFFSSYFRFLKTTKERFIYSCTLFLVLTIAIRLGHFFSIGPEDIRMELKHKNMVFIRLDAILYGFFAAYIIYFNRVLLLNKALCDRLFKIGLFISISILFAHYIGRHPKFMFYQNVWSFRLFMDVFLFSILASGIGLLLPKILSLNPDPIKYQIARKVITHLSVISYSIYLIHNSLIFTPLYPYFNDLGAASAIGVYVVYWILVIYLSTLIFNFFEKPFTMFLRLKYLKKKN